MDLGPSKPDANGSERRSLNHRMYKRVENYDLTNCSDLALWHTSVKVMNLDIGFKLTGVGSADWTELLYVCNSICRLIFRVANNLLRQSKTV